MGVTPPLEVFRLIPKAENSAASVPDVPLPLPCDDDAVLKGWVGRCFE